MLWIYSKAVQTFLKLKDTIASYSGLAGKHLKVNSTEDGVDTSTDVDADIHDAVLKKHTQNTDTKLQDGAGVDSVVVNSGGIVDLPKQSGCKVYQATAQSVPNAAKTKIQFDTIEWDEQNEYDATTNYRFTALKAGKYSVYASVGSDNVSWDAKEVWYAILEKNGSEAASFGYFYPSATVTDNIFANLLAKVSLAVGDYIEIFIYQNQGSAVNTVADSRYTWAAITKDE